MNDETVFDESALVRLRRLGGDEFVRKMINVFFEYAPTRVAAARAAQQAGDLLEVAKAVHSLKSSAGQIGARRVQDLCAQVELAAKENRTADVPILLRQLEEAFEFIRPRLELERKPAAA